MPSLSLKEYVSVAVIALAAGFTGSMLPRWVTPSGTIRATRFEVVGPTGEVRSFWGPESNPAIPNAMARGTLLVFIDPNGVRRLEVGSRVGDSGPELVFFDKNGPSERHPPNHYPQPRVQLSLGYNDDPYLTMHDRTIQRITLGAIHGDAPGPEEDHWCLSVREPVSVLPYSRANVCVGRGVDGKHRAELQINDQNLYRTWPPKTPNE